MRRKSSATSAWKGWVWGAVLVSVSVVIRHAHWQLGAIIAPNMLQAARPFKRAGPAPGRRRRARPLTAACPQCHRVAAGLPGAQGNPMAPEKIEPGKEPARVSAGALKAYIGRA